jgi:hypothetical protein
MPEWVYLLLIGGVILALVGVIWRTHELHDRERNEHIWDQVGRDSRSGMRGAVHDTASIVHGHGLEIGEVQRRLELLERKVFNGRRENER